MSIIKFNEMFSSSKFKLGLDYHGVVDDLPQVFEFLAEAIINNGGEVHIITGGTWESVQEEMKKKGINIRYTHYFSIIDYHREKGTPTKGNHPKYGFPLIDDDVWNETKSEYCKKHNISLHIDDTLEYGDSFKTPFARLWTKNKTVDRFGNPI